MMPDKPAETPPDGEFSRFEDLTRDLLRVPKTEVQEKLRDELKAKGPQVKTNGPEANP